MTWKKGMIVAVVVLFSTVLVACGKTTSGGEAEGGASGKQVVNVFNWSEYLPDSVIQQFEVETGIKVNYDTYSSNEEMMAKLFTGNAGYDIAVATTSNVDIMIKEEMIQPINKENIPNIENIGKEFLGLEFDPNDEYSVPYMWGNVVIAVNEDLVDFEVKGYKDLYHEAFQNNLVVLDDQRSMIGIILQMLGYSQNSIDEGELEEAKQKLLELVPNIKAYDSDSPKTLLVSNEVKAGLVWGAEASLANRENPSIKTVLPEEGMNLWQDNFVIPTDAPNKENAEKFINFILQPEVSVEISLEYPYSNPNLKALELLPQEILNDPAVYPPISEIEKGEHLKELGEYNLLYDRIWSEIKQ